MARRPDTERRLVPRWRTSNEAANAGELRPMRPHKSASLIALNVPHFEQLQSEWRRRQTIEVGADLVSCGVVLGRSADKEVLEAARLIEKSDVAADLRSVSHRILSGEIGFTRNQDPISFDPDLARAELHSQIATQKRRVRVYPKNALAWTDLARLYTALGQQPKARDAIRVATSLAPNNRFVLRSAARFHVHADGQSRKEHIQEGLQLLRESRLARVDPWIMAAEISLSTIAQQTPRTIKWARALADADAVQVWDSSELNGALGTLAIEQGGVGKPGKFFSRSLRLPTENALAQAQWALDAHQVLAISDTSFKAVVTPAFEALALRNRSAGHWDDVIAACKAWSSMEPTSTRPLILGGYVAEVALANGEIARGFSERALLIAPNEPWAHNNLAVAFAYLGNLREAEKHAARFQVHELADDLHAVHWATLGLLAYRRGDREHGLDLYLKAARTDVAKRDVGLRALVMWHLLQEEARLGVPGTKELADILWRYTSTQSVPELKALHDRIVNPTVRERAVAAFKSITRSEGAFSGRGGIEKDLRQLFDSD